jgi:phosphocarrier protein NPr
MSETPNKVVTAELTIVNQRGLHLRLASEISKAVAPFLAEVTFSKGNRQASARSPLAMVALAAPCGSVISLRAEGQDAEAVTESLLKLFRDCDI